LRFRALSQITADWTIGRAVSSGCVRMMNQDVVDLYDRVKSGSSIVVT